MTGIVIVNIPNRTDIELNAAGCHFVRIGGINKFSGVTRYINICEPSNFLCDPTVTVSKMSDHCVGCSGTFYAPRKNSGEHILVVAVMCVRPSVRLSSDFRKL